MIREATKSDINALVKLLSETTEFSKKDILCCIECLNESLVETEPSYKFICAEKDGEIEGLACFDSDNLADNVTEVYWVVVAMHKRKNGVGKSLLSHIESTARNQNSRMIVLETESDPLYENARKLYTKCGFSKEALIPDFYKNGNHKEIYVKRLN